MQRRLGLERLTRLTLLFAGLLLAAFGCAGEGGHPAADAARPADAGMDSGAADAGADAAREETDDSGSAGGDASTGDASAGEAGIREPVAGMSGASAGAAGSAGSAGTGGSAGSGGLPPVEGCIEGLMSTGRTIGACERCACQPNGCAQYVSALRDDVLAVELMGCMSQNNCNQECCLCGGKCGVTTYGDGPCAEEIERAAGVTPGGGLGNVAGVMAACVAGGPEDNACAKASRLNFCMMDKCGSSCSVPVCM